VRTRARSGARKLPARGSRAVDAYGRAVVEIWLRLTGRAQILSPRDWSVVTAWHARGVPLALVRETFESEVDRLQRARGPAALAALIDEAWTTVLRGRLSASGPGAAGGPTAAAVLAAWRERRQAEPAGSLLGRLLDEVLARSERSHDPEQLDRTLDGALLELAGSAQIARIAADVERNLADYRGRMTAATYATTRDRALRERLRRAFGLPRLSGASEEP
jgi:hypothetical protein